MNARMLRDWLNGLPDEHLGALVWVATFDGRYPPDSVRLWRYGSLDRFDGALVIGSHVVFTDSFPPATLAFEVLTGR